MRLSFITAAIVASLSLYECSTKLVVGYLPNRLLSIDTIDQIPFDQYTHLNYAFAMLNNEDHIPFFTENTDVHISLPKIVDRAHANQTKVLLSVGGWTGSKHFSTMAARPESRKKFIDWQIDFIEKYKTDGIDLHWKRPGQQTTGCNTYAPDDVENYFLLLKELREALDTQFPNDHKEISMAVHVKPFEMSSIKEYVPYFDHMHLLTYDVNGAWASTTGPNAPFQSEEGKGAPFSFVQSIEDWKAAGVPAEKITAGIAFYGRAMTAKVDMTLQRSQFQSSEKGAPKGDSDDVFWQDSFCQFDKGGFSGLWKWANLREEGLIQEDTITPGEGWERNWDSVSQTPWLFNPSSKQFITYDDPQSLKIKIDHALCENLAGVTVWNVHQDNGELIKTVLNIHGEKPARCPKESVLRNNLPNVVIDIDPTSEIDTALHIPSKEAVVETPEADTEDEVLDDLGNLIQVSSPPIPNRLQKPLEHAEEMKEQAVQMQGNSLNLHIEPSASLSAVPTENVEYVNEPNLFVFGEIASIIDFANNDEDNSLRRNRVTLAVEHPYENAQIM